MTRESVMALNQCEVKLNTSTIHRVFRAANALTGMVAMLLGVTFWSGHGLALISFHVVMGLLFVLSLWGLCFVGLRAGVERKLVSFAFGWGLFMSVFGVSQVALLPGALHWVVQDAHFLIGMFAMHLATVLHKRASLILGTPSTSRAG